ncbi:MAG: glycosyl transferase [Kiloniellaceae bacterium]
METHKVTIVSFANAPYYPLLKELVVSIRTLKGPEACAISVFDAGLTEAQLAEIRPLVQDIAKPAWDLENLPAWKKRKEHQKAFTCLPFLPRYFPGYDIYLWLDADCWVNDWAAVELYIEGARRGALAICPGVDRAYRIPNYIDWFLLRPVQVRTFLYKHAKRAFGRRTAAEMALLPELNTGVFALHREAPHWQAWADWMERVAPRSRVYGIDQLTVAMTVYRDGLQVELLPAWCNWLCVRAMPMIDARSGRLIEPYLPHHPIGVVHLAGLDALRTDATNTVRLKRTDGGAEDRPLRFPLPPEFGEPELVTAFESVA